MLLIGTRWGYVGVAAGWAAAVVLASLINLHRTLPLVGCSWREVSAAVAPSLFAAAVMAAAAVAVRMALGEHALAVVRLAACIAAGAAVYGGLVIVFNRAAVMKAWRLVAGARR